tara:strand:- start:708 stop:944 length:237 start_codon:yes stop_codon:yes gene_type:complete
MIGSLVKFSSKKRDLYFPSNPGYKQFDGSVGLVLSYTKLDPGDEYIKVRWIKPVPYHNGFSTTSNFNLLNFEVISANR